jgi:hypothetical protein
MPCFVQVEQSFALSKLLRRRRIAANAAIPPSFIFRATTPIFATPARDRYSCGVDRTKGGGSNLQAADKENRQRVAGPRGRNAFSQKSQAESQGAPGPLNLEIVEVDSSWGDSTLHILKTQERGKLAGDFPHF